MVEEIGRQGKIDAASLILALKRPIIYVKMGRMKTGPEERFRLLLSSLLHIIFKSAFGVIRSVIWIGEITKNIIAFPFISISKLYSFSVSRSRLLQLTIIKYIKKYLLKIKSYRIPTFHTPSFRIPQFRFPTIRIPRVRIPSVSIPFDSIRRARPGKKLSMRNFTRLSIGWRIRTNAVFSKIGEFFRKKKTKVKEPVQSKMPAPIHHKRSKLITIKLRYFLLGSIVTLIMVFVYQSYVFVKSLPLPNMIGKVNYSLSTHIYDRNGKVLYEIYHDQNRTPVILDELPKYIAEATVAIEDKDFYHHNGISLVSGILRAIRDMALHHGLQGGSTITQQLVKSSLLTPERTIQRKIKEMILALWTERLYTKNQILEMYLNQVAYGGSSYGIEEAAQTYFGKQAKDLSLDEAALLAGLPQAPSTYSPFNNPEAAVKRRNEVLQAMEEQRYISMNTMNQAEKAPLKIVPPKTTIRAPHFVFYTKANLESLYGIAQVEEGGLKVTTTLDLDIQNEAEKIVNEELAKLTGMHVTNAAVLITRPSTGEILAMVGSADYFNSPSGAFNVTTALRQPGSSIKPIMYSLALQKGFTEATIINDSPTVFSVPGSPPYRPVNYDNKFHGNVPLRYALANSFNVPAVKTLNAIGVSNFVNFAQQMGITTWTHPERYGLSLTLGGAEVKMVDMSEAFGVLANEGYKVPITGFLKVDGANGEVLNELRPFRTRVLDPGIAYIMSDILSDNFARQWEFGSHSSLEIPGYRVAVKTGTTNDVKDNWTIGYTPDFLVAVWVGNNDNTPMNRYLVSGITGAAPIWNRIMSYLLKNYGPDNQWYTMPDDVVGKTCYFGRTEYFIKGTENAVHCSEALFGTSPTPTPTPQP